MSYINFFNKDQIKELNQNVWYASAGTIADGATGRHLYQHDVRHPSYFLCSDDVRDKETHYVIGVERDDHPDHSSRFGYARGPYGYLTGHWPGKYQSSALCSSYLPLPEDMAPKRFYFNAQCGDPGLSLSQANVDYSWGKNVLTQPRHGWWGKYFEEKDKLQNV